MLFSQSKSATTVGPHVRLRLTEKGRLVLNEVLKRSQTIHRSFAQEVMSEWVRELDTRRKHDPQH